MLTYAVPGCAVFPVLVNGIAYKHPQTSRAGHFLSGGLVQSPRVRAVSWMAFLAHPVPRRFGLPGGGEHSEGPYPPPGLSVV